ncbi:putative N-(5'-phosphoribosyl)anthranilate isomerase [Calothrix sp. NIES-4101]|nr:putative N-(5'-phosphoribosyl)anthranilate isomerase [Calothrix sp. NIES-4101]
MKATTTPRVKVCCISSIEEAWIAINSGASALGFVSNMPSGPGVISEELITEITAKIPPPIATFLLTSYQETEAIIEQLRRCRCNTVQICDRLLSGSYQDIRTALTNVSIVQVIHVTDERSVEEAIKIAPQVDALLLDSGNQSLAIKKLGGTGRIHDWKLSNQIRELVNVPIFLAGGLKPENVALAVEIVAPFGLDLCSGVRSQGKLDEAKLQEFFKQLKVLS